MNDKGKDYSNLQPLGLSRLEYLEYLQFQVLHDWKCKKRESKEEKIQFLTHSSTTIEKAIDESTAFLMCNRVTPAIFKEYLHALKPLNSALEIIKTEVKKQGFTSEHEEILNFNRRIARLENSSTEKNLFLPEASEIEKRIFSFIMQNDSEEKKEDHSYLQIFKNKYSFDLWEYLFSEISATPAKTRTSIIYHYFTKNNYFSPSFSIKNYINWIKESKGFAPSKMPDLNYKSEEIVNQLPQFEEIFKKTWDLK